MLNNPNKYEYILRTRIDMIYSLNIEMIYEFINLGKSNKIVKLPLTEWNNEDLSLKDKKSNFFIQHTLNTGTYITTSYTCDYLDFAKYSLFMNI